MCEHAEQPAMASQEHSPVGSPRSAWLRSVYPSHPYYLRPGSVRVVGEPTLPTTRELNTNGALPGGVRVRGVDQPLPASGLFLRGRWLRTHGHAPSNSSAALSIVTLS